MEPTSVATALAVEYGPARKLQWTHWWPALLGPCVMGLVYLVWWLGGEALLTRAVHEPTATHLTAAAVGCFAMAAWRGRDTLHLLLLGLAVAFFCREVHFAGTSAGVYIAVVLLGICAVIWRHRLAVSLAVGQVGLWLVCTGGTYVLSQLIARRVFKRLALPYESELHIALEEVVENTAHLMLIVTAFASEFGTRRIRATEPDGDGV